ncbi:MAG: flagellin [Bacterioplanes sp.]|nr:flagellin [Bacterioplanes sp.]
MPQIINTNIASINAQRNLDKSQSANQQALQRLSSGLRINSAKDDAAGLAISTRFTSQIKGLNVAVRNAGDGIALAQTAEGALGSMNENLQRIRELAVQSANATNSDVDREALQAEVNQLVAEISRTAEDTDFNGRKLLDGSFKATFQIGANAGQTLDVSISELTADKLGSAKQAGVSAQGTDEKLSNGDLTINGVAVRASVSGDDNLSFANKEMSAIAKVAAINEVSAQTGVKATVDENVVLGSKMDSAGTAAGVAAIVVNGVDINIQGTANGSEADKAGTRVSVIEAINAKSGQTGVVASDGGKDGGVILTAADGRNITVTSAVLDLSVYGLADDDTAAAGAIQAQAGFTLTAANANTDIVIGGGNGTGNGDIANAGLKAGTYSAQTAVTSNTQGEATDGTAAAGGAVAANDRALQDGDLVINGVAIRASSSLDDKSSFVDLTLVDPDDSDTWTGTSNGAASGIAIAAAINASSEQTGVTATVNATEVVGTSTEGSAADATTLNINGVAIGTLTSVGDLEKDKAAAISLINEFTGQTGVTASDNGVSLTLQAADGRNITLSGGTDANLAAFGLGGAGGAADGIAKTTYSTVTLQSSKAFDVSYGTNGAKGLSDSGFVGGKFGGGEDGQALSEIDITTFEGAQSALVAIDNAIAQVASQRADLGAIQNRMESTVSNLQVTSENLNAANSRIQDADFAAETAELSRTQVLQQAGISVLAQANASGQQVLSLLG